VCGRRRRGDVLRVPRAGGELLRLRAVGLPGAPGGLAGFG
jgi:hypothetical protein